VRDEPRKEVTMGKTIENEKVADIIAAALHRHGVEVVFAQSIPSALLLATPKVGIRQVTYRTENAGGAMADGYARISGKPGIVCAQNGPAATLLVPPLAEALKASIAVIALVQDVGARTRGKNAFQELDHFALFAGCTKAVTRLDDASRTEDVIDAAFVAACSGRPGPVVVLLPRDVLSIETSAEGLRRHSYATFPLDRTRPDARSVDVAAKLLMSAERPLVIAGGGVHISRASESLAALQEQVCLPVATTNMGKGAVDEGHELSLGVVGNTMGPNSPTRFLRDYVKEVDVVLLVGTRTNENGTDAWRIFSQDACFIHIDVDGLEVGRNYESIRLIGDARLTLEDLLRACRELDHSKRTEQRRVVVDVIERARELHRHEAHDVMTSRQEPVRPERVATELDKLLNPETIMVTDASFSTNWMTNFLRARKPGQRFVAPRGLAGLGWGLPLALGAKIARPECTVVCFAGDGGFGHVWSELETAVRANIPITIVLFNNGILGFQKYAELYAFDEYTSAIDFSPVDHCMIARACGAEAVRVKNPDEVGEVLAKALASEVVTLIEVMTDPDAYPPVTLWEGHEERLLGAR
jgi:acetolactate synthase-1/2/3 large subunit